MGCLMTRTALLLSLTLAAPACTGATFGENNPGGDGDGPSLGTYLEGGSIAVDGQNENVYVLSTEYDDATGAATHKRLVVAEPEATLGRTVAKLDGYEDLRLLFVDGGVMLMGERGGYDELTVYDRGATQVTDQRSTSSRYHGTRVSADGKFVVVADNADPDIPLHVIRASDLSIRPIPHDGDWLEVNWANDSDRLVAAVFYGADSGDSAGVMRLMSWSIKSLDGADFPEAGGFWANPLFDVSIPNAGTDPLFSYSWIAVSPDDSIAAVPLVQRENGANRYRLAVVTMNTGEVRLVDDARGPVGFTPDGSTIVSYRDVLDSNGQSLPHLLMLDAASLEGEVFDEPSPGLLQYFVTRDGNYVVVGDFFGASELTLVDLDNGSSTSLGRALDLNEFVSRPGTGEMYLVDEGLFRLDLFEATLDEVTLSFVPEHINRTPSDQLVVDDPGGERLVFLGPDDGATRRSVALP